MDNKKTTLLFVIDSLNIGGAERSLITLLSHLNYDKVNVDLQLFQYNGELEPFLTKRVNKLPPLFITNYLNSSWENQIKNTRLFIKRIIFSFLLRIKKRSTNDSAHIYWKYLGNSIKSSDKFYDFAIAYGQRIPTYYTIDKIKAKNKICWVNIDHKPRGKNLDFERNFYNKADKIISVSDTVNNLLTHEIFPEFRKKFIIIKDPIDYELIQNLSTENIDFNLKDSKFIILTVSRLNKEQKGLDIALKTAIVLKNKGIKFKWLVIGDGEYRKALIKGIKKEKLEDKFILVGATSNPYPYFKLCNIYVQTSRHEGYGISIEEAKLFNKPIIITNFNTASLLIKNNINGIISSFNPIDIANNIITYIENKQFTNKIINNLENEPKGNLNSIDQFEKLILNDLK